MVMAGTSACLGLGVPVARADAPVDRGWWTATNPGSPVPAQAPPDVPADGLLVQGGAGDTPSALAGLIYEPEAGATAEKLVLKVVASSATTPGAVLQLCPLVSPVLNAQQGGPMADAPAYDCTRKVTAAPDDDGGSYTFQLSALASSGPVAVAVLPTTPTDRVVLAKPGVDSLVTHAPAAAFSPAPFPSAPATTSPNTPVAPAPVAGAPSLGTVVLPAVPPAVTAAPQAPTLAENSPGMRALASVVPTAGAVAASRDHHAAVGAVLLALLAVGSGLWAYAGRDPDLDATD